MGHKRLFGIGGSGGSINGAGSNGVVYLRCYARPEKDLSGPLLCLLNAQMTGVYLLDHVWA